MKILKVQVEDLLHSNQHAFVDPVYYATNFLYDMCSTGSFFCLETWVLGLKKIADPCSRDFYKPVFAFKKQVYLI